MEKAYEVDCSSCRVSQGLEAKPGGIVNLRGGWVINQYMGDEGFLGWLALQPRYHRPLLSDLTPTELRALGPNLQDLDWALSQYWKTQFPRDLIQRVYVVYFYESVFNEPRPPLSHLHIHVIPRPTSFDALLRESRDGLTTINAWKVHGLDGRVEKNYRREEKDWTAAESLVRYLRNELGVQ